MITINLDNLTQAHIDEAAPHIRECSYASPCILGALVHESQREWLDSHDDSDIRSLFDHGNIDMPDEQIGEAQDLQSAFDNGEVGELVRLLKVRGLTWPMEAQ